MKRAPLASGQSHPVQEPNGPPAIAGGDPIRARDRRLIFGAPVIGEAEIASVTDCLRSNWIGLGGRVERFEQEFARYKGAPYAVGVSSGTAAIHLALLALGIGAGDEVIAPAMTFCSTIHSIVHTGAKPVLVDCSRSTFNIDPAQIEERITSRTKAILVVHMCGRCCEMDSILDIARRYGLRVIEDCAHAIEATHHGNPAGLMGDVGCFSFYPTKNITTGDGGMVITRDRQVYEHVKVLSLHGMTADAWSRFVGGPTGYEVIAAGFKYNMTDLAASLGLPQLAAIEERWRQREQIWLAYTERLKELPLLLPPPVRQRLTARLPFVYSAVGFGRAWELTGRRSSLRWMPRILALASTTFPCINTLITGSSLDLPTQISPTPLSWVSAQFHCRSLPLPPSRTWTILPPR